MKTQINLMMPEKVILSLFDMLPHRVKPKLFSLDCTFRVEISKDDSRGKTVVFIYVDNGNISFFVRLPDDTFPYFVERNGYVIFGDDGQIDHYILTHPGDANEKKEEYLLATTYVSALLRYFSSLPQMPDGFSDGVEYVFNDKLKKFEPQNNN